MKKHLAKCIVVAALIVIGVAQAVCAEQKQIDLPEVLVPEWTISSYISATADAEFDNSSASFAKTRSQITADYLDFNISYNREDYSWDNTADLNFGNDRTRTPWDTLQQLAVRYSTANKLGTRGFLGYGGQVASSFEETIDSDSLSTNLFVNYGYHFSKNLMFTVGIAGGVNAIDWNLLPLVGMKYADGPYEVLLGFPKTHVRYTMSKELAFTAALGLNQTVYNLADDSPVASDGYVEVSEGKFSLVADWYPTEFFHLTLGPEFSFARSMKIYSAAGNRMWDEDADVAFGLRAGATLRF